MTLRVKPTYRRRAPLRVEKAGPVFISYLTRKMPKRLHEELKRLSRISGVTIQECLNACLEVGITYYNNSNDLEPVPESSNLGIRWHTIEEGTGESELADRRAAR